MVQDTREEVEMPPVFFRIAAPAFVSAILEPSCYFSCDEVLLIAEAARSSAIVTQHTGAGVAYEVVGMELGHPGTAAGISLDARGHRRVRSLFS